MVNAAQHTGREAVMDAKVMFQRVLGAWAVDVLALRRRGWDKPCLRLCDRGVPSQSVKPARRPRKRAA